MLPQRELPRNVLNCTVTRNTDLAKGERNLTVVIINYGNTVGYVVVPSSIALKHFTIGNHTYKRDRNDASQIVLRIPEYVDKRGTVVDIVLTQGRPDHLLPKKTTR